MNSKVQAEPRLHVFEQIQDLGADRDVEGGDRLVADDQAGLQHQRAGNRDALALPAGEFMRPAVPHQIGVEADGFHDGPHAPGPLGRIGDAARRSAVRR